MNKFNVKTSRSIDDQVYGVSIVNHRIRLKLGLTLEEYIFTDAIEKLRNKKKQFSTFDVFKQTGLHDENKYSAIIKSCLNKGVIIAGKPPDVSDKWITMFKPNEAEFEKFWRKEEFNGKEIKWMGSKADAQSKYEEARKLYPMEYLYSRKKRYFEYISVVSFDRKVMGCSVFLNLKTKRFEEDWEGYINDELKKNNKLVIINGNVEMIKPMTEEEINKLYHE